MVTTHHIEHFIILGYAINAINLEHDVCTLQVDNKRKQQQPMGKVILMRENQNKDDNIIFIRVL